MKVQFKRQSYLTFTSKQPISLPINPPLLSSPTLSNINNVFLGHILFLTESHIQTRIDFAIYRHIKKKKKKEKKMINASKEKVVQEK